MTAIEHARLKQDIRLRCGALPRVLMMNNAVGFDAVRRIHYGLSKGSFDIICCVEGVFLGMEVKTGAGVLTPDQRLWGAAIEACGGIAREVRSVDDALAAIEEARGVARYGR